MKGVLIKITKIDITILLGNLFFLILGFLALYFYQERTMSFDSATFSFTIAQTKGFNIPLGRWGCAFSQVIPLIALKLGCSLAMFLKVYSVGLILMYYIGYLIITFLLKNKKIGLVYILTLCLTYRNTFYFSISEFSQGLALVIVLYAMIEHQFKEFAKRKMLVFALSFFLIWSLYFFHQLLVLVIVFVILVAYFSHKEYKNKKLISLFVFTILWYGYKLIFLSKDSYEGKKIPGKDVFLDQFSNLLELPSTVYFANHFWSELLVPFLVGFVCLGLLLYQKKYLLFLLFLVYPLCYLLLILITYYQGEAPNMYEQYYIYFGFFIAILLTLVLGKKVDTKYMYLVIVPLLTFSLVKIFLAHEVPTQRLNYIKNLAKEGLRYDNRKYIIHPKDFPWSYGWSPTILPAEVLLASSIRGSQYSVTCFVPDKGVSELDEYSINGKVHGPKWLRYLMNVNELDSHFFKLPLEKGYLVSNRRSLSVGLFKDRIMGDFKFLKMIEIKAKEKEIPLVEMIGIDAQYLFEESKNLDKKPDYLTLKKTYKEHEKTLLKKIELGIKQDQYWLEKLELKARKKGISLEHSIRKESVYLLENVSKDELVKMGLLSGVSFTDIEKRELKSLLLEIRNNSNWMKKIRVKAKEKKISVDQMIRLDAKHVFIVRRSNESLNEKELEVWMEKIRKDSVWLETIKLKAKAHEKTIDDVIRKDAKFMLNAENKKLKKTV